MDLIGSYQASGYTVEAYFPENGTDAFSIWVVKDGEVVGEFTTRIAVDSAHGMDERVMELLEAAAEAAVTEVVHREANCGFTEELAHAA